ncbi:MAG: 4-hydroxybenzoate octaprenyltransferase, partial [Leptonema sp. (in: bacteria)]
SIPSRFGLNIALWVARFSHVISLIFLILFSVISNVDSIFYFTIFIVAILFFIEHYLVRGGRIEKIPIAFFNINSIISTILFFGLLLDRMIFF